MTEKPSPESHGDKGAGSEPSPMARFADLARRLVNVPPERVAEEQAKYDAEVNREKRSKLKAS